MLPVFRKEENRGQEALRLIDEGGYDLAFSMGSESTAWLHSRYAGGRLPVVSVCSKDPVLLGQANSYDSGSGTNFAFTSLNMPVEAQMAYVQELKPRLKNIAVIVNSKNVSAMQTQAQPIYDYSRRQGIQVLRLEVQDPSGAREELQGLVAKAVRAMRKNDPTLDNSVFWITGSTAVFKEIGTINAHADRVPVLSVVPEVVRSGADSAVLSVGISFESNAHLWRGYPGGKGPGRRAQDRRRLAAGHRHQFPQGAGNRVAHSLQFLRERQLRLRLRGPAGAKQRPDRRAGHGRR